MGMNSFLHTLPIAHRGLHGDGIPENSLAAFRAAVRAGYAIETDVRLTKDGKIVVFHDDRLLRMTGDPRTVSECTMSELRALFLENTAEKIPTLDELLETADGRVPLLIEIKNMPNVGGKEIARALAHALDGYRGEYAIQSFQPFYVKHYKKLRQNVPCGLLSCATFSRADFGGSPLWRIKAWAVGGLKLNFLVKPDFVSYCGADLPCRAVERFRGTKLAWTIRSPEEEAHARAYADNIIFEQYLPKI